VGGGDKKGDQVSSASGEEGGGVLCGFSPPGRG